MHRNCSLSVAGLKVHTGPELCELQQASEQHDLPHKAHLREQCIQVVGRQGPGRGALQGAQLRAHQQARACGLAHSKVCGASHEL